MSQNNCGNGLTTLKFYLLHRMEQDLKGFVCTDMENTLSFERHNLHVKRIYRHTWKRPSSSITEMAQVMNQDMNNTVRTRSKEVSTEGV